MIEIALIGEDFNPFTQLEAWHKKIKAEGGICHFIGTMRGCDHHGRALEAMNLEHYPTMCKKMMRQIAADASQKFSLQAILLVHRSGYVKPSQPIVLAAAAAPHRGEAFMACQFMMDWLKTEAPFWKEEIFKNGETRWVEARASDSQKKASWENL